jgi:hypothetical protein
VLPHWIENAAFANKIKLKVRARSFKAFLFRTW